MSDSKYTFVFIHGAWQGAATWRHLSQHLETMGYACRPLDLPGAGVNAKLPSSYALRPFDETLFATEPSPNRIVTQQARTQAAIAFVEETRKRHDAPIVLVGHSLGGVTVTAVAEAIPDRLSAVVYVCAFMIAPGMSVSAMHQHPSMIGSLVQDLKKANPREIGAMRINPNSEDGEYIEKMRLAFCGDVSAEDFGAERTYMHCDEPAQPVLVESNMTKERFGRVPRYYFRTLEDRAILTDAQDFMISSVDAAVGGRTRTYTFASAHAPHCSQPGALARTLSALAGG